MRWLLLHGAGTRPAAPATLYYYRIRCCGRDEQPTTTTRSNEEHDSLSATLVEMHVYFSARPTTSRSCRAVNEVGCSISADLCNYRPFPDSSFFPTTHSPLQASDLTKFALLKIFCSTAHHHTATSSSPSHCMPTSLPTTISGGSAIAVIKTF